MFRGALATAAIAALVLPSGAVGRQESAAAGLEEFGINSFLSDSEEYLGGSGLELDNSLEENLSRLVETGTGELFGAVRKAVRSCVLMLAAAVLCSLGDCLLESTSDKGKYITVLAGTLAVSAAAVTDINSLLGLGLSSIEKMASFSEILLPVVAVLTAATGAITGAAVRQVTAVLFSSAFLILIERLLLPLLYGYIALSITHAATGNQGLKRIAAAFKWTVNTLLVVMLMAYVAYLGLSGIISGSADAATLKATKFAISTAVPVVGGIISDASESVLAAAGILRGSVGVFGMLAVLAICLAPFLQLAIHYLAYKLVSALAASVGTGTVAGLIESLGTAFGLILGMMGACGLVLLVSLVSSLMAVTV